MEPFVIKPKSNFMFDVSAASLLDVSSELFSIANIIVLSAI